MLGHYLIIIAKQGIQGCQQECCRGAPPSAGAPTAPPRREPGRRSAPRPSGGRRQAPGSRAAAGGPAGGDGRESGKTGRGGYVMGNSHFLGK
jgi:hypothetical protein